MGKEQKAISLVTILIAVLVALLPSIMIGGFGSVPGGSSVTVQQIISIEWTCILLAIVLIVLGIWGYITASRDTK